MKTPKLRLHKATGQAYVELNGRRLYLGKHGNSETTRRYHGDHAPDGRSNHDERRRGDFAALQGKHFVHVSGVS
jgi:hypothetical protein